jgi:outer membrane biosynthesis protein TonB
MNKSIRTILSLVAGLLLLSALTVAQATGNANKDKTNKEHHSHLSKAAFWRHHKDGSKSTKPAQPAQPKAQSANGKTAQLKPASAKLSADKTQKPEPKAKSVSKPATKSASTAKSEEVKRTNSSVKKSPTTTKSSTSKSSTASKPKPQQNTAQPQTVSLKQ